MDSDRETEEKHFLLFENGEFKEAILDAKCKIKYIDHGIKAILKFPTALRE